MQIVALVGPIGAGKTEIAKILRSLWLEANIISISSLIREEIDEEGIDPTRRAYFEMVVRRRREGFLQYWTSKAVGLASRLGWDRVIIDAIRNPHDLKFLLEKGAVGIEVAACEALRFKRVRDRLREGEPQSDEELWQMLRDDIRSAGLYGFDIPSCIPMCGWQFDGTRPIQEQRYQVLHFLATHGYELNPEGVRCVLFQGA